MDAVDMRVNGYLGIAFPSLLVYNWSSTKYTAF